MVQAGISRDSVSASVAKSKLEFRDGHGELFGWLENAGVPLLLFSAGMPVRERRNVAMRGGGHLISGVLTAIRGADLC